MLFTQAVSSHRAFLAWRYQPAHVAQQGRTQTWLAQSKNSHMTGLRDRDLAAMLFNQSQESIAFSPRLSNLHCACANKALFLSSARASWFRVCLQHGIEEETAFEETKTIKSEIALCLWVYQRNIFNSSATRIFDLFGAKQDARHNGELL